MTQVWLLHPQWELAGTSLRSREIVGGRIPTVCNEIGEILGNLDDGLLVLILVTASYPILNDLENRFCWGGLVIWVAGYREMTALPIYERPVNLRKARNLAALSYIIRK
jgi:hypothetical protein